MSARAVFVTGSPGKLAEARRILGAELESRQLDLPEIQSVELEAVIEAKVRVAFAELHVPVIVDDTGLFFDAWNGLPGALVKWFVETVKPEGICRMLDSFADRSAVARTVVGWYDGVELRSYSGEVRGRIAAVPVGDHGFGWDRLFIPDGSLLTFGEMTPDEKERFSMRWKAYNEMAEDLHLG